MVSKEISSYLYTDRSCLRRRLSVKNKVTLIDGGDFNPGFKGYLLTENQEEVVSAYVEGQFKLALRVIHGLADQHDYSAINPNQAITEIEDNVFLLSGLDRLNINGEAKEYPVSQVVYPKDANISPQKIEDFDFTGLPLFSQLFYYRQNNGDVGVIEFRHTHVASAPQNFTDQQILYLQSLGPDESIDPDNRNRLNAYYLLDNPLGRFLLKKESKQVNGFFSTTTSRYADGYEVARSAEYFTKDGQIKASFSFGPQVQEAPLLSIRKITKKEKSDEHWIFGLKRDSKKVSLDHSVTIEHLLANNQLPSLEPEFLPVLHYLNSDGHQLIEIGGKYIPATRCMLRKGVEATNGLVAVFPVNQNLLNIFFDKQGDIIDFHFAGFAANQKPFTPIRPITGAPLAG